MPSIAIAELAEGIAFLAVLTSTIAHLNRGSNKRLITKNETATLFKGIEFKKFAPTHLELIPVHRLEHIEDSQSSIYLGAYIKVFEGQRFRFLGRLYADGSFALVSETEVKPLKLRVLEIPIAIPFKNYGNLTIVGRQKRNGFYGYVEAKGYFVWQALPNIVKFMVGTEKKPASLKLYSNGQFNLQAEAIIDLFNDAAKIKGSVAISHHQAAFDGNLKYSLGGANSQYLFPDILKIDIQGSGLIEGSDKYRFRGSGEVTFLGEKFSKVNVYLDERYAYFNLYFKKSIKQQKNLLEEKFLELTH